MKMKNKSEAVPFILMGIIIFLVLLVEILILEAT